MKHSLKVLVLAVPLSFFFGSWWGFYKVRKEASAGRAPTQEIHLLTQKGFLPQDIVAELSAACGAKIKVTEANSDLALVNEAFSNIQNYDVLEVSSAQAVFLEEAHKLLTLNREKITAWPTISVDFKNLEYDPDNRFVVPIEWGVDGQIYKKRYLPQKPSSLAQLLNDQRLAKKISLKPSSVEIFSLLRRLGFDLDQWLRDGQTDAIVAQLKKLASTVLFSRKPLTTQLASDSIWVIQAPLAKALPLIHGQSSLGYFFPQEKATLWVKTLAISAKAPHRRTAYQIINYLLKPKVAARMAQETQTATTLTRVEGLNPELQASYLRQLPLSRVELVVHHLAFQPLWNTLLKQALPELFSPAAMDQLSN